MNTTKFATTITSAARTIYWMYSVLMSASPKYLKLAYPARKKSKKASGIDHTPS